MAFEPKPPRHETAPSHGSHGPREASDAATPAPAHACESELLQDIGDFAKVFVVALDEQGRILHAGGGFALALGRRAADLVGRAFEEFVFERSLETWRPAFALAAFGQTSPNVRFDLVLLDGTRLHAEARLDPGAGGSGHGVRAIVRDVSDRVRLEEQLLRTQRMESIGTLAGGIAHDLNNILAPITLCVGLLRSTCGETERREYLRIVEKSALRGSDLVRQVLGFARGAEGEHMPMHPKHVAREIVSILRETFPKSVRVVYDLATDLWMVRGNATQIHQVLLNLCVNARDAMPHGGILTIAGRNKALGLPDVAPHPEARPGDYVVLTVGDTGTGIPEKIRGCIFDPFFTTKTPEQGTGLGLSTALGIVRAHGGFISLETEEGKGTAFHVHLPAHETCAPAPAARHPAPAPRGARELVLVVDDERAVRDMVEKTLGDHGYRVVTASDGIEAVARFMTFGQEIKVLVSDLLMPRMDGPAAIRAIRKCYPDIAIVAMSGNPPEPVAVNPKAAGIDRFLAKPFMVDDLLRAVHDASCEARAHAGAAAHGPGERTAVTLSPA
jgi:PAS domain S-box-containing protein